VASSSFLLPAVGGPGAPMKETASPAGAHTLPARVSGPERLQQSQSCENFEDTARQHGPPYHAQRGRVAHRHGREKGAAPGLGDISDAAPRWLGPARLAKVDYTPKTGKAAPGSGGRTSRRCSAHGLGALGERQTRGLILCGARQRDVRRQRGRPRNAFGLRGVPRAARLLAGSTTSTDEQQCRDSLLVDRTP
jgi:hypothetical protein